MVYLLIYLLYQIKKKKEMKRHYNPINNLLYYMLHVQLYLVISCFFIISYQIYLNRICGVIVGMLASSAVDRGFESRLGQTRDYKIGICCFSAKHAALRNKSKD